MHYPLYMNKSQIQNVFSTFHSHKMQLVALLGLFYSPKWQIFLPFQILQLVKSLPLGTPLGRSLPL